MFDPIESKESWSKLLLGKKRVPPRCEHGDECISLTTKKAGANRGTYVELGGKKRKKSDNSISHQQTGRIATHMSIPILIPIALS